MKIKCTFEDCFQHFTSEKAMIAHKKQDPDHAYCVLCDIDCEDDMRLFIHQLGSPAHICCPVCAKEDHRLSQSIRCPGCETSFRSATALMKHIEDDECEIVRLKDFQMQRAEKQLQKDAWVAESDPFSINPVDPLHPTQMKVSGGASLLDSGPEQTGSSLTTAFGGPISTTSQNHFPPLPTAAADGMSGLGAKSQVTGTSLMKFDEPVQEMSKLTISQTPNHQNHSDGPQESNDTGTILGWLHAVNSSTKPPSDNQSAVASMYDRKASPSMLSENNPPAARAQDPNPATSQRHITTMPAQPPLFAASKEGVARFWDHVCQKYVCPGPRCHQSFKSALAFQNHLASSAHVGGTVVCPSCLKRFASTTAWVAHSSSASKKCNIRQSADYNNVIREITGGLIGTEGFLEDGTVRYIAPKIEEWS